MDRLVTYINQLKDAGEELLVIDNGDSIQGTPLVDLHDFRLPEMAKRSHPLNVIHKHLGVDCFIPGNHEFNFGLHHLLKIKEASSSIWLAANVFKDNTHSPLFTPYHRFEYNNISVCVIGLLTTFVSRWESASLTEGIQFESALRTCKDLIPKLRETADFLVVSYHGGLSHHPGSGEKWTMENNLENEGVEIWEAFPEIDLLITGHQHRTLLFRPEGAERGIIVQPSSYGRAWCHLTLTTENQASGKLKTRQIQTVPGIVDHSTYPPDERVRKSLRPHIDYVENILSTPLGMMNDSFLINDPMEDVWLKKHPLIQWINDLLCQQAGVDIAASPLLDAAQKGLSGTISVGDILEYFFFQDTICLIKLSGEILRLALEKAAGFFLLENNEDGTSNVAINPEWKRGRILSYNYDIWEGIEYTLDIRKPQGHRLTSLLYHKKPVLDKDEIFAAVTSYRAGGAFYQMLSPDMIVQEFPSRVTDLMTNDLLEKKHLSIDPIQNFTITY